MFLLKVLICCYLIVTISGENTVTYLEPDVIINYKPQERRLGFYQNELQIYCYRGAAKTLLRFFESVELQLDIPDDDYTQYEGITPAEVRKHFDENRSLFSFNIFSQKRPRLQISPFGQHCIGIEASQSYRVRLQQMRVDFWRVIQLTIGIVVFIYAGQLSHNSIFFYAAGVSFGICSSFMLLIWLASKLVPRRPVMYGVLIGGWTVGIYMIQLLWENIQVVVVTYRSYVFWYLLITGLISFFLCYRWGPPQNKRSKNIIKWTLQFLALMCIYLSSYFEEATVAIIVLTFLLHYFPRSLLLKMRTFYLRRFPPKPRLLSSEEFYEEGVRETTKALYELRKYASSPECKQWRLMSKLKDPFRFAEFVEGGSHLLDEEILSFENSNVEYEDESDSQESEVNVAPRRRIPDDYYEISDDEETQRPVMKPPHNGGGRQTPQPTFQPIVSARNTSLRRSGGAPSYNSYDPTVNGASSNYHRSRHYSRTETYTDEEE